MGYSALLNNTGTSYNTAIGTNSLRQSWGSSNTALGESSLNNILNGDQNVSVGRTANQYLGTGSSNVGIGYNAGLNFTSGNNNIAIGASSSLPSNTGDNQLSIGNWIYGTSGNIGIGTASPGAKLEVAGTVKINTAGAYLDYRPNATACTAAQVLAWSGSVNGWVCSNDSVGISGSGLTTNYLTKWNGAAVANSQVFDNGTNVGIGTSTGTSKLTVAGSALVTGDITVQ